GLLQINGLLLADLVVRNAAMHAVRAAVVCDSDKDVHDDNAARGRAKDCAQQAAQDVTKSVRSITTTTVDVQGAKESGTDPVTVTVYVDYHCQVPLVGAVACGLLTGSGSLAATATIQRQATLPNQGHFYKF